MRRTTRMSRGLALLMVAVMVAGAWSALSVPAVRGATTSAPLVASVHGPTYFGTGGHGRYQINASGGPAQEANGTYVGQYNFTVAPQASNTTNVVVSPSDGILENGSFNFTLNANNVSQTITLVVQVSSVYQGKNETTNVSTSVQIVTPYKVSAVVIASGSASVLSFSLQVLLDGQAVGSVSIPQLTPGENYTFTFSYVTLGLSSGWHTFSISLGAENGLVTFAGGALSYAQSFYIPGAPPDYTIWYIAGAFAFFGAIFIFISRVAARRRGTARP
ncbi:MAG: CARDB domain-containing protein [Thermoplasmata archaeon]